MRRILLAITLVLLTATLLATPASASDPDPTCVPTNGGDLDNYSEACVDPNGPGCRVWHLERDGTVTCYVPL